MAEIALNEVPLPARVNKSGWDIRTLTNPSGLKIQAIGPGAEIILNAQVPQGKAWKVSTYVEIEETEA